jgi:hypothetical protein
MRTTEDAVVVDCPVPVGTPEPVTVEIGHDVSVRYLTMQGVWVVGLIQYHPCRTGRCGEVHGEPARCAGGAMFDLPGVRDAFPDQPLFTVTSWNPLTLAPALQCACPGCGHVGYILEGQWVPQQQTGLSVG